MSSNMGTTLFESKDYRKIPDTSHKKELEDSESDESMHDDSRSEQSNEERSNSRKSSSDETQFNKQYIYFALSKKYVNVLEREKEFIIKDTKIKDICLDKDQKIKETEIFCTMESSNFQYSCDALLSILEEVQEYNFKRTLDKTRSKKVDFMMLVPHCMIPPLIGKKGNFIIEMREVNNVQIFFDIKTEYPKQMRKCILSGDPPNIIQSVIMIQRRIDKHYEKCFEYSKHPFHSSSDQADKIEYIQFKFRFVYEADFLNFIEENFEFLDACQTKNVIFSTDFVNVVQGLEEEEKVGTLSGNYVDIYDLVDVLLSKFAEFCQIFSKERIFKFVFEKSQALILTQDQNRVLSHFNQKVKGLSIRFYPFNPDELDLNEYIISVEGPSSSKKEFIFFLFSKIKDISKEKLKNLQVLKTDSDLKEKEDKKEDLEVNQAEAKKENVKEKEKGKEKEKSIETNFNQKTKTQVEQNKVEEIKKKSDLTPKIFEIPKPKLYIDQSLAKNQTSYPQDNKAQNLKAISNEKFGAKLIEKSKEELFKELFREKEKEKEKEISEDNISIQSKEKATKILLEQPKGQLSKNEVDKSKEKADERMIQDDVEKQDNFIEMNEGKLEKDLKEKLKEKEDESNYEEEKSILSKIVKKKLEKMMKERVTKENNQAEIEINTKIQKKSKSTSKSKSGSRSNSKSRSYSRSSKNSRNESNSYSDSRSRSRSRFRSRSRSRSRSYSDSKSKSGSKSRSRTKDHQKQKNRKESHLPLFSLDKRIIEESSNKRKSESRSINKDRNILFKNISYDLNGVRKIGIDILVPDYLTPILIGKRGVNINEIEKRSNCKIFFRKFDKFKFKLNEGIEGRRVRIIGTPEDSAFAYKMLLDNIIKEEKRLWGGKIIPKN